MSSFWTWVVSWCPKSVFVLHGLCAVIFRHECGRGWQFSWPTRSGGRVAAYTPVLNWGHASSTLQPCRTDRDQNCIRLTGRKARINTNCYCNYKNLHLTDNNFSGSQPTIVLCCRSKEKDDARVLPDHLRLLCARPRLLRQGLAGVGKLGKLAHPRMGSEWRYMRYMAVCLTLVSRLFFRTQQSAYLLHCCHSFRGKVIFQIFLMW